MYSVAPSTAGHVSSGCSRVGVVAVTSAGTSGASSLPASTAADGSEPLPAPSTATTVMVRLTPIGRPVSSRLVPVARGPVATPLTRTTYPATPLRATNSPTAESGPTLPAASSPWTV